jgi:hypothetical protein
MNNKQSQFFVMLFSKKNINCRINQNITLDDDLYVSRKGRYFSLLQLLKFSLAVLYFIFSKLVEKQLHPLIFEIENRKKRTKRAESNKLLRLNKVGYLKNLFLAS